MVCNFRGSADTDRSEIHEFGSLFTLWLSDSIDSSVPSVSMSSSMSTPPPLVAFQRVQNVPPVVPSVFHVAAPPLTTGHHAPPHIPSAPGNVVQLVNPIQQVSAPAVARVQPGFSLHAPPPGASVDHGQPRVSGMPSGLVSNPPSSSKPSGAGLLISQHATPPPQAMKIGGIGSMPPPPPSSAIFEGAPRDYLSKRQFAQPVMQTTVEKATSSPATPTASKVGSSSAASQRNRIDPTQVPRPTSDPVLLKMNSLIV
jgi:hypothetical protein